MVAETDATSGPAHWAYIRFSSVVFPALRGRKSRSAYLSAAACCSRLVDIRQLLDVLDHFANAFDGRFDLDHVAHEISTSFALEPIVLISRNISWVRNSSFRRRLSSACTNFSN